MASRRIFNGSPTTKITKDHTYSWPKATFLQSTPVPEAATSTRIFRMVLLATYFWFGCFV